MDPLAFLVGIVIIMIGVTTIACQSMYYYHQRELRRIRSHEIETEQKFMLINKAIDNKLPPPRFGND